MAKPRDKDEKPASEPVPEPASEEPAPEQAEEPIDASPVDEPSESSPVEEPAEQIAEPAPLAVAAGGPAPPPPPPAPPTTGSQPVWYPETADPKPHRGGTLTAVGVMLVVVGIFAFAVRMLDVDLNGWLWPLVVLVPGLALLVYGFASRAGTGAVPGGIVTMVGLTLAYQNDTDDWASWWWVWPLVMPGGVGLGIFLRGLRKRDAAQSRRGLGIVFVSLLFATALFVIFENVFNISSPMDYGWFGKAALPALLVVIGILFLARNMRRRPRA
jgi:hypothetical protein